MNDLHVGTIDRGVTNYLANYISHGSSDNNVSVARPRQYLVLSTISILACFAHDFLNGLTALNSRYKLRPYLHPPHPQKVAEPTKHPFNQRSRLGCVSEEGY